MAGVLLVGAEGVILQQDNTTYAASRPILEGLELITQLRHLPTSMVTVVCRTADVEGAEYWIRMQGLAGAGVVPLPPEDKAVPPAMAEWYAIERCRAKGPINLVITAHPEVFERCALSHQPVLLFARRGSIGSLDLATTWETVRDRAIRRREAETDAVLSERSSPSTD